MLKALLLVMLVQGPVLAQSFKTDQLRYSRVRDAQVHAHDQWQQLFAQKELAFPPNQLYIRAFKYEKLLEVWVKDNGDWTLLKAFDICRTSGKLGPKRKEGDLQIPEGFYHINYFNPSSSYHLSLKVNYPNASDKILSHQTSPGGDIFIHGKCVTIGCLPMTDDGIKSIYWLCVLARSAGQARIPISIFPCKLTDENIRLLKMLYNDKRIAFWENLKVGYDYFVEHGSLPIVSVDATGRYVFR